MEGLLSNQITCLYVVQIHTPVSVSRCISHLYHISRCSISDPEGNRFIDCLFFDKKEIRKKIKCMVCLCVCVCVCVCVCCSSVTMKGRAKEKMIEGDILAAVDESQSLDRKVVWLCVTAIIFLY